jgi:hypothetical protein
MGDVQTRYGAAITDYLHDGDNSKLKSLYNSNQVKPTAEIIQAVLKAKPLYEARSRKLRKSGKGVRDGAAMDRWNELEGLERKGKIVPGKLDAYLSKILEIPD